MKFEVTGSPILARQNPALYQFIMLSMGVVVFLLIVAFIVKKITAYVHSPKYIEAHTKNTTTKKNLHAITRKASLNSAEMKLLWHMCKKNKAPNIVYLNKDPKAMDELLRKQYLEMKTKKVSQESIGVFFSMAYKLERCREEELFISSSNSLKQGQELVFKDADGYNWTFSLIKNTPQGIYLAIPKLLKSSERKPEPLSKFVLTVTAKANIAYSMPTRAIRYEEAMDGTDILVIKPGNSLEPIQRRKYRRSDLNVPCIFTEVEPRANTMDQAKNYAVMGQNLNGTLANISAAGCSLIGKAGVKIGRYLLMKFQLNGDEKEAVGIIISTSEAETPDLLVYHLKFTDIQLSVKNMIQEFVYGYDEAEIQ